jgi:hypothetical protein
MEGGSLVDRDPPMIVSSLDRTRSPVEGKEGKNQMEDDTLRDGSITSTIRPNHDDERRDHNK